VPWKVDIDRALHLNCHTVSKIGPEDPCLYGVYRSLLQKRGPTQCIDFLHLTVGPDQYLQNDSASITGRIGSLGYDGGILTIRNDFATSLETVSLGRGAVTVNLGAKSIW
jgi:hypothetical protein